MASATKAKPNDPPKQQRLRADQQIQELSSLRQSTVAWLLDLSERRIRELVDLRRNSDGSYNFNDVVQYLRDHRGSVELDGWEEEKFDYLAMSFAEGAGYALPGVLEFIRGLREKHGSAGVVKLVDSLVEAFETELMDSQGTTRSGLRRRGLPRLWKRQRPTTGGQWRAELWKSQRSAENVVAIAAPGRGVTTIRRSLHAGTSGPMPYAQSVTGAEAKPDDAVMANL